MPFQYSLSLYQCTLLPICTVATGQLLYAIPILTVTISVHTVTNMYDSHSTVTFHHNLYVSNPHRNIGNESPNPMKTVSSSGEVKSVRLTNKVNEIK